jgi:hypothetical protein
MAGGTDMAGLHHPSSTDDGGSRERRGDLSAHSTSQREERGRKVDERK